MKWLSFFILSFCLWGPCWGQNSEKYGIKGTPPKGLMIGERAPLFSGQNQYGQEISLEKLLKKGSVVLVFYRGDWCPVCNKYLKNYQDSLKLLIKKKARLVAVTPETVENVVHTIKKTDATFNIIADEKEEIMQAYKVLFDVTLGYQRKVKLFLFESIAENNGKEAAHLPIPATYIINKKGKIVYRHVNPNYKNRASVAEILEHLP